MGYIWAKYEGSHFLDNVPPLTRSRKKGALKFAAKLLLKVEIFAVFNFLKNPPCYVVVAIALSSSPVFPGARWHDGARHAQLLFSSVSRKAKRKLAVWLAIDLKCYYDEILMSCVSHRIIYSSSLRKTVTWNFDFHPTNWKKLGLKSCFFASAIVNLRFNEPAV